MEEEKKPALLNIEKPVVEEATGDNLPEHMIVHLGKTRYDVKLTRQLIFYCI